MRKRWIVAGAAAAIAALCAGMAWSLRDDIAYAHVATGYVAKQTCSCLRVSGRDMASCMTDLPAEARDSVAVTQEGDIVRASVLFGAVQAEAAYDEAYGCRIAD